MPHGAHPEEATVPLRQRLDTWDNEGTETNVDKPFDKLPYTYGVLPLLRYRTPKQQLDTRTIKEGRLRSSSTSESCRMATVFNHQTRRFRNAHILSSPLRGTSTLTFFLLLFFPLFCDRFLQLPSVSQSLLPTYLSAIVPGSSQ